MKTAVRYFSRSGNTKALAEAIAKGAGTEAVSVDSAKAPITEPVDVLFIGGALYAYGLDPHMKEYLETIDGAKIGKAVVFSTSWLSKHALDLIRKSLSAKGVSVEEQTIYAKSNQVKNKLAEAEQTAQKYCS